MKWLALNSTGKKAGKFKTWINASTSFFDPHDQARKTRTAAELQLIRCPRQGKPETIPIMLVKMRQLTPSCF